MGSEEYATLDLAAQEVAFDQQLWDANKVIFKFIFGAHRYTLFLRCANGDTQILMANCKSWKA